MTSSLHLQPPRTIRLISSPPSLIMPDRLSRLFKSKLLRRSSTSAVSPDNKKASSKAVDPSLTSSPSENVVSTCAPLFASPNESTSKSRAYSVVSSLPLDHPSSPDDILAGPATPATGSSTDHQGHHSHSHSHYHHHNNQHHQQQSQYFDPIERSTPAPPTTPSGKARPDEVLARRGGDHPQQLLKKKSAERPGSSSLDPISTTTTTTTTTTTANQWQPEPHRKKNLDPSLQLANSPSSTTPPLPAFDPVQSTRTREREQRPGIAHTTTTTTTPVDHNGNPQVSTPSLAPVAESPPSDEKPTNHPPPSAVPQPATSSKRPSLAVRRQSLLPASHQHLSNLLDPGLLFHNGGQSSSASRSTPPVNVEMAPRKIWVRRPGGSPTLVPILEDALVDELRDQVIVKYTNSLGKTFDSPDIVIKVVPRDSSSKQSTPERLLNPEESLATVVDTYYPGGQAVEEALIIDIPPRRTPKPSPRPLYYHSEPAEHGDYFSIVPMSANVSTPPTHTSNSSGSANPHQAPSISILTTGKAPPLASPGSTRTNRQSRRPPMIRHSTNSPTMLGQTPPSKGLSHAPYTSSDQFSHLVDTISSPTSQAPQPTPKVPTPPVPPQAESPQTKTSTPPPRGQSPRARPLLKEKKASGSPLLSGAFGGLIEGTVPPINVLIVEDNIINQKLLEAFMKRLKVRWKCAGNGEEALKKWRQGGFHLVLMDIQLPVMNGLEATKEIRRLERLNGIGVFPKTPDGRSSVTNANTTFPFPPGGGHEPGPSSEEDTLYDRSLFKSPVIIVALTASSLQSDRHEALAAGCNDFLTKVCSPPSHYLQTVKIV